MEILKLLRQIESVAIHTCIYESVKYFYNFLYSENYTYLQRQIS
jgi:hypothetical protein